MLKMLRKGVWPHLKRWIQAWLANPKILVTFEGAKSKKIQGSVLSPLLFLFYIDHLHWGSRELHISLFADDGAICAQDSKLHIAEKRLQQGLYAVTTWSKDWKMLLSAQKTESLLFDELI